ncbi:hypothetical protein WJX72_001182 [[Myrmecia] bisecta]|uniref:Uncharacterized protein n=1 Tax=[Myrmecia] bisecta TaxID=41462 RepID=A0AAW1QE42_9CHLO
MACMPPTIKHLANTCAKIGLDCRTHKGRRASECELGQELDSQPLGTGAGSGKRTNPGQHPKRWRADSLQEAAFQSQISASSTTALDSWLRTPVEQVSARQ